jgi:hypothetical protein
MKKDLFALAAALCLGFTASAFAADTTGMNKDAYKGAKDKLEAQYKADKKACDGQQGNAKDICKAEAKGKDKIAKAELDAQYKPSARADEKVRLAKADADYDVAKQKCGDMKGNSKDVCRKDAKAAHESAKGQAKADKTAARNGMNSAAAVNERQDAAKDTADAQYAAAKERCDAMKGGAKDRCIAGAKRQFSKS